MALPILGLVSTALLLTGQEATRKYVKARDEGGMTDTSVIQRRRHGGGSGSAGMYGQNTKYPSAIEYPVLTGQLNNAGIVESRIARQNDRPWLQYTSGLYEQGSIKRYQNTDCLLAEML